MSAPSLAQRVDWTGGFRCATDQAVLRAIARWFCYRADGICRPFTVEQLAYKAGVPHRSAARALGRLAEDWRLDVMARRHRQPTRYRIVVERLAMADPDAVAITSSPPEWHANEALDCHSGTQEGEWHSRNGPDFDKVARQSTEAAVRTDPGTAAPAEEARHSGSQRPEHADVTRFLEWARVTYPLHACGAQLEVEQIDRHGVDRLRYVVHGLLERYGLERLQTMAVTCWTIESDGDPESHASWIAKSDRSLRVLRHKAAFLERVVVGAQQLELGPLTPDERPERLVDYIARTLAEARAKREQTG